jgi:uncharacterized repeat protein (TIGR04042 family)
MPEVRFRVRWPDQSEETCYSPSSVIKEYFKAGDIYTVPEFVTRSREALNIASDRVAQKFGFHCSSAMDQIQQIEKMAAHYPDGSVLIVGFVEK